MAIRGTGRGILAEENAEKRAEIIELLIQILHDEEGHRRLFEGFLRECETDGLT